MRVLFVWPNKDQFGFKPIGLSLLSAILKSKGHEVSLFDTTYIDFGYEDNTETLSRIKVFKEVDYSGHDLKKKKLNLEGEVVKKLDEFRPDIIGVSALSDEIYVGLDISKIAKSWNKNVIVIWGNKAATMDPETVLGNDYVDYVCIDEGMEVVPEFVECVSKKDDPRNLSNLAFLDENGKVHKNDLKPYFQDLDSLPFLDWSIFDGRHVLKPYDGALLRGGDHMISWGCPYICTYCANHSYRKIHGSNSGRFYRTYSVDRILNELRRLVEKWDLEFFKFHDEEFALKHISYFKELAERYPQEVGVPFSIMANARNISIEKVELLKKMGCASVSMGIETGNEKLRNEMLKRLDSKDQIIHANKMLNDAGIRTVSFNMLGIPFETRDTVMETVELNREAEVRYPNAVFFFPFEGLKLRDTAIENGFFDPHSGKVFEQDKPALTLPGISEDDLVAMYERFVLYIKMPNIYYKYIIRSEKKDSLGAMLTDELYRIYEECVFTNDGVWNDNENEDEYIKRLDHMLDFTLKASPTSSELT